MAVLYPTRNLTLGLLFLHLGDIDLDEFEEDDALDELVSSIPDPKYFPVPQASPIVADERFELLRQSN